MAIFNRLTDAEIRMNFTHYGLLFSFVPVYIGKSDTDCPHVEVRNWWPEWLLDAAMGFFHIVASTGRWMNPDFEPSFWFVVTGEIE